jgi:uncharacterized protein
MNKILTSSASGILFGAGLAVAQMTNPAKVISFLDVAGSWDPSLAFVMGAALIVSGVAYQVHRTRLKAQNPIGYAALIDAEALAQVDGRLVLGASLFGLGWGLAGFCPGPAIASLVTGSWSVVLFVGSMLIGMGLFELLPKKAANRNHANTSFPNAA